MGYRIGQGFDLHQFAEDRDLILGGVIKNRQFVIQHGPSFNEFNGKYSETIADAQQISPFSHSNAVV